MESFPDAFGLLAWRLGAAFLAAGFGLDLALAFIFRLVSAFSGSVSSTISGAAGASSGSGTGAAAGTGASPGAAYPVTRLRLVGFMRSESNAQTPQSRLNTRTPADTTRAVIDCPPLCGTYRRTWQKASQRTLQTSKGCFTSISLMPTPPAWASTCEHQTQRRIWCSVDTLKSRIQTT